MYEVIYERNDGTTVTVLVGSVNRISAVERAKASDSEFKALVFSSDQFGQVWFISHTKKLI